MKSDGDVVEILEAFDLTGSLRDAAELAGCAPNTVGRYVRLRAHGRALEGPIRRNQLADPYLAKVEEWVERSTGKVRADVVHDKLRALGFAGSERTTRRAVARAKKAFAAGHRRVFRPWIPEPGMWFQFDWGKGPRIGHRDTVLWCAWLAWSRFRVVIPTWDRTMPTVIACLDETLRRPCSLTTQQWSGVHLVVVGGSDVHLVLSSEASATAALTDWWLPKSLQQRVDPPSSHPAVNSLPEPAAVNCLLGRGQYPIPPTLREPGLEMHSDPHLPD